MPRPQDIQDLMIHSATRKGAHSITQTPAPDSIPASVASNFIDDGWLSDNIPKMVDGHVSDENLPSTVPLATDGVVGDTQLPNPMTGKTYQSTGDAHWSGFLLADGTDLMVAMARHIENVGSGIYSSLSQNGSLIRHNSWDCLNCMGQCVNCYQCDCNRDSATSG